MNILPAPAAWVVEVVVLLDVVDVTAWVVEVVGPLDGVTAWVVEVVCPLVGVTACAIVEVVLLDVAEHAEHVVILATIITKTKTATSTLILVLPLDILVDLDATFIT